ncbi:hypothetical protein OHA27_16700 [Streptomyces sp. NBC_01619]|uniref:Uncharacterized protein n=1 Tax=Streptomyces pratisoli TaxID=3139917 RepID=A0ACC6QJ14_9ACTN|nr:MULTISPECIES: hypothetical protein [unclassified Streptomyces]MCX4511910.1 hypothetical protein [Streptomyces sp. NBC_01619]
MSAQPSVASDDAPAGAGCRLLRAAVFAAVCVVLSALGHVLAACATVPWWTLLAGFLIVLAVAAPLAGRSRSLTAVVAALAGGQLVLHTLFGLGQRPLAVSPSADDALIRMAAKLVCGAGGNALSPADAHRIVAGAGIDPATAVQATHAGHAGHAAAPAAALGSAGLLPSVPMVLGHLLAALATGWLLRRGDLAMLRLAELSAQGAHDAGEAVAEAALVRALRAALVLVRELLAGLPGAPGARPRPVRTDRDHPAPPVAGALQHTVIRRGPPAHRALASCVLAA